MIAQIPRISMIAAILLVGILRAGPLRAAEYVYETLEFPGSLETFAYDINNDNVVAGSYTDDFGLAYGFLWEAGEYFSPELDLELVNVFFNGINNDYDVVGSAIVPAFGFPGFLLFGNEVIPFEYPGAIITLAEGVNDNLEVVGTFLENLEDEVFRGYYTDATRFEELTIPDFVEVLPIAINNQGQIVGGAYDADGVESGFIIDAGGVTLFNHPDGETELVDINNLGMLAGTVVDAGGLRSFVSDGEVFQDVMFPDATETVVWGINDTGVLVGEYLPAGSETYLGFIAWPVPVPEPSSQSLLWLAILTPFAIRKSRPNWTEQPLG